MICCRYALHSPNAWNKEFEVSPSGRAIFILVLAGSILNAGKTAAKLTVRKFSSVDERAAVKVRRRNPAVQIPVIFEGLQNINAVRARTVL